MSTADLSRLFVFFCRLSDDEDNLRILLVADPQLIGLRDEPPLVGIFTRWDADRLVW